MNNWSKKSIGKLPLHIGDGNYSGKYPKATDFLEKGIPFISASDFSEGRIKSDNFRFISEQQHEALLKGHTKFGDVLLVTRGNGVGSVAWVDEEFNNCNLNAQLALLRTDEKEIHNKFLYYLLSSTEYKEVLISYSSGSAQPQLPIRALKLIELSYPEYDKQKAIAKILRSLDDKIHLNNQINQTLESIAQAIFKSWFIDFEPVRAKILAKQEGKDAELAAMCAISGKSEAELEQMSSDDFAELQATAALFPDEFVESELGEVPKGWGILDIDKTTSLIIDHRGKTPKKLGADWSDRGVTALSAKHIKNGCIVNREQLRFVDTELYNKWMKEELKEGDILLTSEGPMGEMYYLAFDEKYCLSQRLYALRANTDLVSSAFLYFWFLSPFAKSDMNGRATGTTVVGIRQSELRKVKVLTPSKSICDLFHQKVTANLKQIELNNNESVNLAQIRDILLPKLLSGEVDLTDFVGEDNDV